MDIWDIVLTVVLGLITSVVGWYLIEYYIRPSVEPQNI